MMTWKKQAEILMQQLNMVDIIKEVLISEKGLPYTNCERLKKALVYTENNLIDYDGVMYLTADSLIEINNKATGWNNITLRKVNVKPYTFNKIYIDKDLINNRSIQWKKNYDFKVLFNTAKKDTYISRWKWRYI